MWISQKQFLHLADRAAIAEGKASTLAQQNLVLQTTMDWQRVRLTQLEIERAQLLAHVSGVQVPVPVHTVPESTENLLKTQDIFADIGDAEAKRQGLSWDDHGNLVRE